MRSEAEDEDEEVETRGVNAKEELEKTVNGASEALENGKEASENGTPQVLLNGNVVGGEESPQPEPIRALRERTNRVTRSQSRDRGTKRRN